MHIADRIIGDWGPFQTVLFAVLSIQFFFTGVQAVTFMFTGGVPPSRCALSPIRPSANGSSFSNVLNLFDLTKDTNLTRFIYAPPILNRGKEQFCYYCPDNVQVLMDGLSNSVNETCSMDDAVSCSDSYGYIFDDSQLKTTLVSDFDMVCSQGAFKRQLASSLYMAGYLVGAASAGALSDRFGRRKTLIVFSLGGAILGTAQSIIVRPASDGILAYPFLCIVFVLNGALNHGALIIAYVIIMEYTGVGKARTIAGVGAHLLFSLGFSWVGVLAAYIHEWRYLQLALSAPALSVVCFFWFVPESVRWLMVHGKRDEAIQILKKAARMNRHNNITAKEIGEAVDEILDEAIGPIPEGPEGTGFEADQKARPVRASSNGSIVDLFRYRGLATVSIVVFFSWFACAMLFWGTSLNTASLPGNEYVNHILNGLIEVPGSVITVFMLERLGRKPSLVLSLGFGGLSLLGIAGIPTSGSLDWLIVTLATMGKLGGVIAFAVVYNYSAEIFPTLVRNVGVGFASAFSRIASIASPQIALLAPATGLQWLPFGVYGTVAITVTIAAAIVLPETQGKPFPDTLEDGIALSESGGIFAKIKAAKEREARMTS